MVIGHGREQLTTMVLSSIGTWLIICVLLFYGLPHHPHSKFGAANAVTASRAMTTSLLAGLIPIAHSLYGANTDHWMWFITGLAVVTLTLDGFDGYLARKSGLQSAFGARFDMEIDALLALIISLFLWQSGKSGVWVLSLGIMRYAFVIASYKVIALRGELFASARRKAVCVLQVSALCALLCPAVVTPYTTMIGLTAAVCLAASFIRDIVWLVEQHGTQQQSSRSFKIH